mgnify:CR=1 FL=1
MFFSPKKDDVSIRHQLCARPVRNKKLTISETSEDRLQITVDLKYDGWKSVAAKVKKAREKQTYELDGLGLDIFRMIDDQKTVGDLVDFLIDLEKLTFFESWGLIQHYLGDLAKRGIIAIVVPER